MALAERSQFPHLSPAENTLFRRWLILHENEFERFDFDVRVGEGAREPVPTLDKIAQGFVTLTQKRIDVVAHRPGEIWIIEVRPRADQTALGNLMGYRTLYQRQFSPAETVKLMVITDRIGDDDRMIFMTAGVPVVVV